MTTELRCPVCPGRPVLRPLDPHLGLRAPLRRCDHCHGLWTDRETAEIASRHYHPTHYVMTEGHGRQSCRGCGLLSLEPATACPSCFASQLLPCVQCGRTMELLTVGAMTLDVCRACVGIWFDRGELAPIVRQFSKELAGHFDRGGLSARARNAGVEDGAWAVDPVGAVDIAVSVGESALTGVAGAADAGAAALALEAGHTALELSGRAAEAVLDIVAAVFSL